MLKNILVIGCFGAEKCNKLVQIKEYLELNATTIFGDEGENVNVRTLPESIIPQVW